MFENRWYGYCMEFTISRWLSKCAEWEYSNVFVSLVYLCSCLRLWLPAQPHSNSHTWERMRKRRHANRSSIIAIYTCHFYACKPQHSPHADVCMHACLPGRAHKIVNCILCGTPALYHWAYLHIAYYTLRCTNELQLVASQRRERRHIRSYK